MVVKALIVTPSTLAGRFLGWYLGGYDGFLYTLIAFVVADYITGVLSALNRHELSSAVGFRGITKKVLIFVLVGLANLLDVYILGHAGVLRMATIFFYISNEGISLLENTARLGLPIPTVFKKALTTIHQHAESTPPQPVAREPYPTDPRNDAPQPDLAVESQPEHANTPPPEDQEHPR